MQDVDARLAERHAEDRSQAWSLIALGIPFALGSWLFLSWMLTLLLWVLKLAGLGTSFGIAAGVVAILLAVDTWRHPSEYWHQANYFVPSGNDSLLSGDGWSAGMPLMASVSDPGNLAERGRVISSGCANVALGGPRNVRKGFELLRLAKARQAAAPAARKFLVWLRDRSPLPETELPTDAFLRRGFLLARELGLLAVRSSPEGRHVLLK